MSKKKSVAEESVAKGKPGRKRERPFQDTTPPPVEFPYVCSKMPEVTATTYEELEEKFGWRRVGTHEDGSAKYRPQAWSRKARAVSKSPKTPRGNSDVPTSHQDSVDGGDPSPGS